MAVASRNPFALLGDEDTPSVSVTAPAAKTSDAAPKRTVPGAGVSNGARGASAPRGGRGGARGGRAATEAGAGAGGEEEAPGKEARRGGARGRGEARGGRGRGEGRGRGRGRVFDRHSATGKEDSQKNLHQGWGGDDPKRELDVDENARADAAEEGATPAGETVAAATPNGVATPAEGEATEPKAEVEEEKDNTKTLDEYLAEQAAKRAQIGAKKEARQADAADPEALGKKLEKQDAEDYYKIQRERAVRQREKKEKQVLEIEQTFNTPSTAPRGGAAAGGRGRGGERGRGGRGGGRGGFSERGARGAGRGTRGAPRGGASTRGGANLNLSDESAFPTLG